MSSQEVVPEKLAELFHHYYEALAPDFRSHVGDERPWNEIEPDERRRIVAAVRLAIRDLDSKTPTKQSDRERYFAKPGEAEWGC